MREFSLESKVHVDVTPLGTIGFQFVQPGDEVNAAALSTVSITVVPVPKPADVTPAGAAPLAATPDVGIEAIDGLSDAQVGKLRAAHVTTVGSFQQIATRSSTTASLISLLGVDRDTVGRYALLAGLLTVPGLDKVKAAILYDAGITDVATLAAGTPAQVVKKYASAARRSKIDDGFRPDEDVGRGLDRCCRPSGRLSPAAGPLRLPHPRGRFSRPESTTRVGKTDGRVGKTRRRPVDNRIRRSRLVQDETAWTARRTPIDTSTTCSSTPLQRCRCPYCAARPRPGNAGGVTSAATSSPSARRPDRVSSSR